MNVEYRETGALNKRKGYQYLVRGDQGSSNFSSMGLAKWEDVNTTTGAVTEKLITLGDELYVKETDSIIFSYTGSGVATYDIILNSTSFNWEFLVKEDGVVISTQVLGDGTGAGDMTISTLVTNLHALTDFTCTGGALSGSEKAAFIPTVVEQTATSSGTSILIHYFAQVLTPSGLTAPFSGHYAKKTDESFENATFAQMSDVMFISNGYDYLCKYDGNRVYVAGLAQGAISSIADHAAGTTHALGAKFDYRVEYEFKDARENTITGQISDPTTHTMIANKDIAAVVHNIKESAGTVENRGFNLDQASVNGNQVGVNAITVTSGHDIIAGDYVYFLDGVSGSIINRKVSSVDTTTVTVEGAVVNVGTTEIISNIKIYVYRTIDYVASGVPGLFYLSQELVNDSTNDTQGFTDSLSDANLQLNLQFIEPIVAHGLAPKAKYIIPWRGQLILSGSIEAVSTVYYSDITSPEYFPLASQSFNMDRPVSGMYAQDNILYVFEKNNINAVTGDFSVDQVTVNNTGDNGIGCEAHASIAEVRGEVYFLSRQGIYAISEKGLNYIGQAIDPKFNVNSTYAFKQAVGFNWIEKDKYMIFLPRLTNVAGNTLAASDTTSEIYVYDYFRQAWLQWDNFNFMGGIAILDDELVFNKRTTSGGATPDMQLVKLLTTDTEYDYSNHSSAIDFSYATHWETLGEPSVWKKFLRLKVHSIDSTLQSFETDAFSLNVTAQHNYETVNNVGDFTIDFSGGALGWGNSPWGDFPWGEARLKGAKNKLASKKIRSHRLVFANTTIHENILISGYELQIVTPYRPDIKE